MAHEQEQHERPIPEHLQRYVVPRPPPFYTPLSARWQHSYAYTTLTERLGAILDMTLDQFRMDMKEILEEEEKCEEEGCGEGGWDEEEWCEEAATIKANAIEENLLLCNTLGGPWICAPPDIAYSFLDGDTSDMSAAMKLWVYKAAGLKLDRSIPPRIKSETNLCPTSKNHGKECETSPPIHDHQQELAAQDLAPCHPERVQKEPKKECPVEEEYELVDDPRFDEWNNVEKALIELKHDVWKNAWLKELRSDAPDVAQWNLFLKERAKEEKTLKLRWMCTVWMYAESYFYRRLNEIFENTQSLWYYDPFFKMKEKSFQKFLPGMDKVSQDFLKIIGICPLPKAEEERTSKFLRMFLTLSLWGNRHDLMQGGPTSVASDFTHGNPLLRALTFAPGLLVDEMDEAYKTLTNRKLNANRRVDIVTDNAGFELFADMLLADFILSLHLADRVHFHVKAMPWFVSDATRYDLYRSIEVMAESRKRSVPLAKMAERWYDYIACGQWVVEDDYFWTLPYGYDEMRCKDGPLYAKLTLSSLIIFKGDLNYRKLVGDVNWEPSVPFGRALRAFRPTCLLALRPFKSDLICGVPLSSAIHAQVPKGWMLGGTFAVAHFAKRKECVPGLPGPP